MDVPPAEGPELDREKLLAAMIRSLPKARLAAKGQVALPAAPSLLDHYAEQLSALFAAVGRPFSSDELAHLKSILEPKLREGFAISPYTTVIVRYETDELPKKGLRYTLTLNVSTIADEYNLWVKTRTPPLFGSHPDAKIGDLARSLGVPAEAPILEGGAGTGRNLLPLARAGHPADAIELSPDLARILRESIANEGLNARVFECDLLDPTLELPRAHYRLFFLCEVVYHLRFVDKVRVLFERAAELLAPGGLFAFSAFLPEEGYEPDTFARELSDLMWCTMFTREELAQCSQGLGFELVSDESVYEYEKAGLAPEAWPPTGWFAEWSTGLDLFDLKQEESPVDMRWLVYRKV